MITVACHVRATYRRSCNITSLQHLSYRERRCCIVVIGKQAVLYELCLERYGSLFPPCAATASANVRRGWVSGGKNRSETSDEAGEGDLYRFVCCVCVQPEDKACSAWFQSVQQRHYHHRHHRHHRHHHHRRKLPWKAFIHFRFHPCFCSNSLADFC